MVLPVEQSCQETLYNQNQKYFSFFDLNNSTKNYNNHLGKNSSGLIFFTT